MTEINDKELLVSNSTCIKVKIEKVDNDKLMNLSNRIKTFNYAQDFWPTGKIRCIITPLATTSKWGPLHIFVEYLNDVLTILNGKDIFEKNSRGDQLKSWTEILLSQIHVWDT